MTGVRSAAGALLVAAALVASGCGDGAAPADPAPPVLTAAVGVDPQDAVQRWLTAVAAGDGAGATDLVNRDHLALLIGVENVLGAEGTTELLRLGVADELAEGYWSSFAASFVEIAGSDLDRLEVGAVEEFAVGDRSFGAVVVAFPDSVGRTEIITVATPDGWEVDLMATFGPDLVRPLRDLFALAPPGAEGDPLVRALAATAPSLQAALQRPATQELSPAFVGEVRSFAEQLGGP